MEESSLWEVILLFCSCLNEIRFDSHFGTKATSSSLNVTTKVSSPIPRLTEKNYSGWNRNIQTTLQKKRLWKYTQSEFPAVDKDNVVTLADLNEKTMETTDLMTPTITAPIKVKLTEAAFNDCWKMFRRLKELLQSKGETQFIRLTQEYDNFAYKYFANIAEFLDHIKLFKEQIDKSKVTMTEDKRTLFCFTMAL